VSKTPAKNPASTVSSPVESTKKASTAKGGPKATVVGPAPATLSGYTAPRVAGPRLGSGPVTSSASFAERFSPPKPQARTYPDPMTVTKPAVKADPKLATAWKNKAGRDLTEAELLAMPEDEYMNDKQLEYFRSKLQEQKDSLLSNAGATTEHLREDTSIVPDPADRATIEEEHALELRTRDRERKLLKKISQSIARIDAGDYGFCDETGEPIGLGRLLARPTATLSLEAQQRRELKQKMFGD